MRYPASQGKADANQPEIVKAFESVFCSVFDAHVLGFGFPDLVVGCGGVTLLVEVKTEDGDFTPAQKTFIRDWRGSKVHVVRTPDEAINLAVATRKLQATKTYRQENSQ